MIYDLFGPYPLPLEGARRLARDAAERREFWDNLEEVEPGLSYACGCYVVSVRGKVWYIGMAERQDFRHECFTPDKILKIDDAMHGGRGVAFLTLIARHTSGGSFSRPSINGHRDVRQLELLLIGAAIERNPRLLNRSSTKVLREIVVPGFINSPAHSGKKGSVKAFARIMGL